jgi:hypothetical protein
MNIARRLSKLATAIPAPEPLKPTREEQKVLDYLVARALVQLGRVPEMRDQLTSHIAEFERQVRQQAATPITDQLKGHIAYVEDVRARSGREMPFIPPIIGMWYDDSFAPDLLARRLAVRRHPAIVALIGDTVASPWGRCS